MANPAINFSQLSISLAKAIIPIGQVFKLCFWVAVISAVVFLILKQKKAKVHKIAKVKNFSYQSFILTVIFGVVTLYGIVLFFMSGSLAVHAQLITQFNLTTEKMVFGLVVLYIGDSVLRGVNIVERLTIRNIKLFFNKEEKEK